MEIYKNIKKKVMGNKKRIIAILLVLITLLTIFVYLSDRFASDKSDKLLVKSIDMNTYLLSSFTDRLRAFNSEFELLSGACSNSLNKSLLFNYDTEIYNTDDEFTVNQLRKFDVLTCKESLNMLQHYFKEDSITKLGQAINLSEEVYQERNKPNKWRTLSNILTMAEVILIIFTIFLYSFIPEKEL
ncbi:MAG: hypothetical protein PHH54_07355 [Candidatus Nanoarchaeia archaeon]|nr:hypothetical protein [Candidatus Nanoarchaeia archaeon]MDD5741772.1 hypothetical protein [Candidatus Nanoarchaeia archaeon]